ncbi:unnamed protein product, partial [Discosporangium mesarthrocarpum]
GHGELWAGGTSEGLVVELRSNVRLENSTPSEVELHIEEGRARGRGEQRGRVTARRRRSKVVRLSPGKGLTLPLPMLKSTRLRLRGDATDTVARPIRLSPALLDPTIPDALRSTRDMERNSLCLRGAKKAAPSGAAVVVAPGAAGAG